MHGLNHYVSVTRTEPVERPALRDLVRAWWLWTSPLLEPPARVVRDSKSSVTHDASLDSTEVAL